ncbi:MAG TPA: sigma-70 family RNA polymerase sigma factor [Terriglobia bacterium]|nr:sigma-70 family RNA polymerase sigma factor [Terriglobia bacterium]
MEDGSKSTWIVSALERHESHLVRYAMWILGDIERAREVVQETFLRLCKEKPSRIENHLAQWLFTVCRNLALDVRKKENRMSPLSDADVDALPSERLGPRPLDALEHQEKLDQVLRVVERLPKNQREVILLKFQFDLSYKEISEITHLSATNVGFLIHTAIHTLRKELLAGAANGRIQ